MAITFIVGSGQSNAMGTADAAVGGDTTTNTNVKIWNGSGWITATAGVAPLPTGNPLKNNAFWNLCKRIQEDTGDLVYFVLSGLGSTPISEWGAGQTQWINLNSAVTAALASPELTGKKKFPDMFCWMQGEQDGGNSNYANDFLALRNRAINAGWMSKATPIGAGEILNDSNISKKQLIQLAQNPENSWLTLVSNKGPEVAGGGIHFTGPGLVDWGRNAWFAAYKNSPRIIDFYYTPWTPVLSSSGKTLDVVYDTNATQGGMYRYGNIISIWFQIKLQGINSGAGQLSVTNIPFPPTTSIPNGGVYGLANIASYVSGVNLGGDGPVVLKTKDGGIALYKCVDNGNYSPIAVGNIRNNFTIYGSISYFAV